MLQSDEFIIKHTQNWLRSFIVKLTICPFAQREIEKNSLRIHVSSAKKTAQVMDELMTEIEVLNNNPTIETILLIFSSQLNNFFDYLDFIDRAELELVNQGYEGVYQLASFHPDYCFADVEFNDVSNYTNRSPYPMLHLLREKSVEKAIAYYGDTAAIPVNNIALMHKLGLEKVREIVADCKPGIDTP